MIVAVLAARDASARTEVLKTRAGSVVHWTQPEITVGVDASAGSRSVHPLDVVLAIQRAANAWNRIPASQPHFRFTSEPAPHVTIRFCRSKWQGDTVDLGSTQFDASPRDGMVSSATIEFNECDHRFTPPGETTTGPYDLQSVMTHEFGHVLGLGHGDSGSAVMYPSGNGVLARLPAADDETALAVIYIGRESPASVQAAAKTESWPAQGNGLARPTPSAHPSPTSAIGGAPADSISVLNFKASGGREVTIYTHEPTLLPPLADSRQTSPPKRAAMPGDSPARDR